jgi:hypothetical protein
MQGEEIEIRYLEPTDFIKSTGVERGDIKFKGKKIGLSYTGKAYIHTIHCTEGFEYKMSGSESADLGENAVARGTRCDLEVLLLAVKLLLFQRVLLRLFLALHRTAKEDHFSKEVLRVGIDRMIGETL